MTRTLKYAAPMLCALLMLPAASFAAGPCPAADTAARAARGARHRVQTLRAVAEPVCHGATLMPQHGTSAARRGGTAAPDGNRRQAAGTTRHGLPRRPRIIRRVATRTRTVA